MESVALTLGLRQPDQRGNLFDLLASVTVPTLVLDSEGSSDDLIGMAAAVAGALPQRRPPQPGR